MTRVVAAEEEGALLLAAAPGDEGGGVEGALEAGIGIGDDDDDDDGFAPAAAATAVLLFVVAIGPRGGRDDRDDIARAVRDWGELRRAADAALATPTAATLGCIEMGGRRWPGARAPAVAPGATSGAP